MVSDVQVFVIGITGGVMGAGLIVSVTMFHFQQAVKQHVKIKSKFKEMIDIKRLQEDINALKMQVVALQAYFNQIE